MTNEIQQLLTPPGLKASAFPATSRYHGIDPKVATSDTGETIVYLKRRFVPPSESFALLQYHSVVQVDRLDNLAHKYLGDPEQFWRLCDANGAMRPDALTDTVGRRLRITLPEGIPGGTGA